MTRPSRTLRFFAVIGALSTAVVVLVLLTVSVRCTCGGPGVPARTVLEIDFERPFLEHAADDPVARALGGGGPTVDDLVAALERARTDDRVVGLVAHVGGAGSGFARTQELRDAIAGFRAGGKFAVAFSETFGEFGPGNQGYYLATAFDEIWLQPSGDVGLNGLMMQGSFYRGTLDKLEVGVRMDHRHEYKNALNTYTERAYTPAHREASQAVLSSMFDQFVADIAEGRKLAPEAVRTLIDRGPFLGPEAHEEGLVDRLGYRDEVMAAVKERAGAGAELLWHDRYLDRAGRPHTRGTRIAVVYGIGPVARGKSSFDPLFREATMGSETVAGALRAAIDDPEVKAIVFRVDSPGGSYVASDTIWRETVRAKQAGKPLIVSMGNVAGSGGYFVAMHATKIVAQPGTITGSIGVLGGKMLTRQLFERLGVTYDSINSSANSDFFSENHDYSAGGWQRFQGWLDRVYLDFTSKVAEGRGLPIEKVREVAKGRIWTGADAKQLGLVDELGGWPVALRLAREAAGLAADADIELKVYPEEKGLLGALLGGGDGDNSEAVAADVQVAIGLAEELRPVAAELRALGLGPGAHGAVSTPPVALGD
ncbi:signal peptide peptidase SppA [Nannocystis pusilla]|uniref:Signal peptide peptidase SppA n=1 Tax=Nannocystis pusilla TaxID=889268 RepID=A0ABS7U4L5_9BACT|nr:signal peptide peptidase SppA [Nannocystis pusilla]MBZ5715398.1 signal peptide peptidase SppA [Nannocystis pusilla]